jgi:heme exporter protein B
MRVPELVRDAGVVAGKDLRIEWRSRVATNQVVPFGGLVVLLFAMALNADRELLHDVAPGLYWVTLLLASTLAVGRSAAVEEGNGARDALRMSGLDGASIFLGKAAAVALQLLVLELVLGIVVCALYDVALHSVGLLVVSALAATIGLAAAGTVFAALASGLRARDSLLPLLVLPILAPVLLGGTRAWEAGFDGVPSEGWPWVELLAVFGVVYAALGVLAYGPLLEDT